MRFELNLANPLLYTPVMAPKPTQDEICRCLYENRAYVANYATQEEKKKFIGQWKWLVDNFAKMLSLEIGFDLYQIKSHDIYENLATRLKKGIAQSILDSGDGLLPNQNSATFCDLKLFLEAICVYTKKHPEEKHTQELLKNLYKKLELCGPGLFTHFQQAYFELYQPADNLFYWLANYREMILTRLVAIYCDKNQITDIVQSHAYNAFSAIAKKNQWHLLQENKNIDDILINTAIPKEWENEIYAKFEKDFKEEYKTGTVAHLSERLAAFIIAQFNQHASHGVLSSENHDQFHAFFNNITPVLDSFKLCATYFLKVKHEIDPTQYTLNQMTLERMAMYVAFGLHESGMLETSALTLLCTISNARVRGDGAILIGKKIISDTSHQTWLREFKAAFDANPPEAYQIPHERNLQRRTRSLTLFSTISAFDNFLDELGLSSAQTIPLEDKLTLIINSPVFYHFMIEQLKLTPLFLQFFCEKYPAQQHIAIEKTQPQRKHARR